MAEQEVIIREAQPEDAEQLIALLAQAEQETDFLVPAPAMSLDIMQDFLSTRDMVLNEICLVATVGGELVGVLNVTSSSAVQTEHVGDLFIAVKKAYWGYGLGSFLMEAAVDWAEHSPMIRRLELTVQKRNVRAVHLYEKFGFKIEGTKYGAVKTKDGEFLDVYLMGKWLE